MATDKLINQTQGADIIDALSDIATNVGNITYGPQTSADKVVSMTGYAKASAEAAISAGDTLNQAIGKLEKKADDNATAVADKIDKLTSATAGDIATVTATGEIADSAVAIETTLSDSSDAEVPTSKAVGTYVDGKGYAVGVSSSTANNLVAFNDANGKALKDSGISVATSTTGLADSDTAVPTSKTVKTYVDSTATGISRYIGTITAASQLSTSAKKGDFYIVKTAWSGVHAGDEIIAEKDSPSQTIDGTNWSLLHNEADTDTKYTFATGEDNGTFKVTPSDTGTAQSVPIKGLGNAAYKGVADTVSSSTDLVTSNAVNTKLASYVPNSDFVVAEQNIDYALNTGVKNLLTITTENETTGNVTFTHNSDGSILVNTGSSGSHSNVFHSFHDEKIYLKAGTYVFSGCPSGGSGSSYELRLYNNSTGAFVECKGTPVEFTLSSDDYIEHVLIRIDATYNPSNMTFYPMICAKSVYDQYPSFVIGALPNSNLTILETEDRAALAEVVDSGAKNLWANGTSGTISGWRETFQIGQTLKKGTYIISFDSLTSTDTDANTCQIIALNGTTQVSNYAQCPRGNKVYTILEISADANALWIYSSNSSGTGDGDTATFTNGMICTKAAFGVSSKFVPYRPNYDLVADSVWKYSELRYTNTATNEFQNTGVSFTVPANRAVEFYAYDRKDAAYLDSIVVCDSETNLSSRTTTIVSINRIESDGFTDSQYWTLQTTGIIPTYNAAVTYYVWVKRRSTGSNPVGLAYRFIS